MLKVSLGKRLQPLGQRALRAAIDLERRRHDRRARVSPRAVQDVSVVGHERAAMLEEFGEPAPARWGVVETPSGFRLTWAEYGDPAGQPVLYCHGLPGRANDGRRLDANARAVGVRIVSIERPGWWRSPFRGGQGYTAWARDALAILEHLGITEFGVIAVSGGSLWALAAAEIAGRATPVALLAPAAPAGEAVVTGDLLPPQRIFLEISARFPCVARSAVTVGLLLWFRVKGPTTTPEDLLGPPNASTGERSLGGFSEERMRHVVSMTPLDIRPHAQTHEQGLLWRTTFATAPRPRRVLIHSGRKDTLSKPADIRAWAAHNPGWDLYEWTTDHGGVQHWAQVDALEWLVSPPLKERLDFRNLDFRLGVYPTGRPVFWSPGWRAGIFTIVPDPRGSHSDGRALRIQAPADDGAALRQTVSAVQWRGRRIAVSCTVTRDDDEGHVALLVDAKAGNRVTSAGRANSVPAGDGEFLLRATVDIPPTTEILTLIVVGAAGARAHVTGIDVADCGPAGVEVAASFADTLVTDTQLAYVSRPGNLGFDEPPRANGLPGHWGVFGVLARVTVDSSVHHSDGGCSARMDRYATEAGAGAGLHQATPIHGVGRVRFSAWLRGQNVGARGAAVRVRVRVNGQVRVHEAAEQTGTFEWVQQTVEADVPLDAEWIDYGVVGEYTGTVWVDDCELETWPESIVARGPGE